MYIFNDKREIIGKLVDNTFTPLSQDEKNLIGSGLFNIDGQPNKEEGSKQAQITPQSKDNAPSGMFDYRKGAERTAGLSVEDKIRGELSLKDHCSKMLPTETYKAMESHMSGMGSVEEKIELMTNELILSLSGCKPEEVEGYRNGFKGSFAEAGSGMHTELNRLLKERELKDKSRLSYNVSFNKLRDIPNTMEEAQANGNAKIAKMIADKKAKLTGLA